eukprot:206567-Pelagomonas_calceolata.AAC.1
MRLYNSLTRCSSTTKKILQADMRLSSRPDYCWSSHILSAMNGPEIYNIGRLFPAHKKEKEKLCRQRKLSLHHFRKRRHIGSEEL